MVRTHQMTIAGETTIDTLRYGHETIVMSDTKVSKSRFKAEALELFREVERTGKPLVITDRGIPVLRVIPYKEELEDMLAELRGSILEYIDPDEPVGLEEWELLP